MGETACSATAFHSELRKDLTNSVLRERSEVVDKLLRHMGRSAVSGNSAVYEAVATAAWLACSKDLAVIQKVSDDASKHKDERAMYEPLIAITRTIESLCAKQCSDLNKYSRPYCRQVVIKSANTLDGGAFPEVTYKPDFVIADVPSPVKGMLTDIYIPDHIRWRQCPAFIEAKANPKELPRNERSHDATAILCQTADYARIVLSARPFQLYAYGILLCGDQFALALFDRRGIVVSPGYSITKKDGFSLFTRIILCLTWYATPVDLGEDPTVSLLPGQSYFQKDFPRFSIQMDSDGKKQTLITVKSPLWVSQSLLGRATRVWSVIIKPGNHPAILKTSWRTKNRSPESQIYEKIIAVYDSLQRPRPSALATYLTGGDVSYGGVALSTYRLRMPGGLSSVGPNTLDLQGKPDAIVTRVLLDDVGKALWRYSDAAQLGKALLDVLQTHETLCEDGIIHRDISAGNILIKMSAEYHQNAADGSETIVAEELDVTQGFLADFELASVKGPPSGQQGTGRLRSQVHAAAGAQQSKPGDAMTGTVIFMATKLLLAISNAARNNLKEISITRTAIHDLESFYWVILYVVYRHTIEDEGLRVTNPGTHQAIKKESSRLFSALNPGKLVQERQRLLLVDDLLDAAGMQNLLEYMEHHCPPLSGLLLAVWRALRECASSDAGSKKKIPESRIEEEQAEFAFLKENGLPVEYTPRSEKRAIPTIIHRRLCLDIQRMLIRLNNLKVAS